MNQNQKNKNNGNKKKFVCLFDPSHSVESEQKLRSHMRKCKAMQKNSYLCCKYNDLHWVKHDVIDSHEECKMFFIITACPDKNKVRQIDSFTRILPEEISQYSMLFEVDMSMVQSSSMVQKKETKVQPPLKQNDGMKKKEKHFNKIEKKAEMWKEPSFIDYLKNKGYKQRSAIIATNQNNSFIGNDRSFLF